jgi:hypothetical protein
MLPSRLDEGREMKYERDDLKVMKYESDVVETAVASVTNELCSVLVSTHLKPLQSNLPIRICFGP